MYGDWHFGLNFLYLEINYPLSIDENKRKWGESMNGIKGKITLVTGAAKGLGKAMACRLAQEGAVLVVADIDRGTLDATVAELTGSGFSAEGYQVNLCNTSEIDAMIDYVVKTYGRIDILINNAGIQIRKWATEFPEEEYDQLMDINLKAYYFASRAAARYMKLQGGGVIVCTSSANSERFTTKRTPYCISKAAVNALVAALGNEWGRFNIRINAVAPGYVYTDMVGQGIAEGIIDEKAIMSVIPLKRFLGAEEIASAVSFLASDDASAITGQTLFVDGGWNKNGLPEAKDLD